MLNLSQRLAYFIVLLTLVQGFFILAYASDPEQGSYHTAITDNASRISSLTSIDQTLARLATNLKTKQDLLGGPGGQGRESEINDEIQKISQEIAKLENNFRDLAANVELDELSESGDGQAFSLLAELEKLVKPLISQLKKITALPREIEDLRTEIEQGQQQLKLIKAARKNTNQLLESRALTAQLELRLKGTKEYWIEQEESINTELAIFEQRLKSRLAQQTPLGESLSQVFELFFKTRGRNLLLAVFIAGLFFLLLQKLFLLSQNSKLLKQPRFINYNRLIILFYILLSALGTALIFILILYTRGDWLLLTLALLFLLGVAWASREALPRFWSQLVLLLNMGPVREAELVVIGGVTWKVEKLSIYTQLINSELSAGVLRVPVIDLINLRSRMPAINEKLFPTKVGDWVLLDGEFPAQIRIQTPSIVEAVELGGRVNTFRTENFVNQKVINLSHGFRCITYFGLDYQHQKDGTHIIPEKLQQFILERLAAEGYDLRNIKCVVEFDSAATSALTLAIIIDYPGKYANEYKKLQRMVQKFCVEACNQFNWIIPFDQLTVHLDRDLE